MKSQVVGNFGQKFVFWKNQPLIGKFSKFCSKRIHHLTDPRLVCKFRIAYPDRKKISPDWRSTPLEWFSITRDLDLDLGSGHTAYHHASLIDAWWYAKCMMVQNFIEIVKTFFLDGLTAGTPPCSRSCDTKSRTNIKNSAQSNLYIVL